MRILIFLLPLVACTGEGSWEAVSRTDRGAACLEADADAAGTIYVDAEVCLSSSCDRAETASCTATVDGSTITVTSQFDWETATGNQACTDDCGFLIAECDLEALPAGDYTLVHGDESTSVTVPTTDGCSAF